MKKILLSMMLSLSCICMHAQDYASRYTGLPVEVAAVTPVKFPSRTVSLTDFGAKGDGMTLCSEAFSRAIESLSAEGGGRLHIPAGVWLTGPLELKSDIELHLDRNAIIYFSPDKELYVDPSPKATRVRACISANGCRNIGITGEGIIDGNGAQWRPVKRGKVSAEEWKTFKRMGGVERAEGSLWYPWEFKGVTHEVAATPEKQEKMRNDLFRVNNCENILLEGVTFQNAPKFHVHPFNSVNVIIDGITVRCPWNAQNGDAIDISDCHRVLIVNATIDCGDDGLCMKSGSFKPKAPVNGCEDILIEDCTVYHAHGGFVIGSEDICGMHRIVVRDCRFAGTDTGLRFKSAIGRGGKTGDIYISDIVMTDIKNEAVIFECSYADRPAGSKDSDVSKPVVRENIPEFTDIHISGVTCRGCRTAVSATGIEGLECVHGIDISNSTFVYDVNATVIKDAEVKFTDVTFEPARKL